MIQQNFIRLFEKSFAENWELKALSDYKGITYTYGEVARQVARLHLLYEGLGIKRGEKIAIFGKNSSNWCISFLSVFTYGAVAVPILADFRPGDAHAIVNHSDSVMLFVDKQVMGTLSEAEMKGVGAILSLDNFGILSARPSDRFTKAFEDIDGLFDKRYKGAYTRAHVKYAQVDNSEVVEINYTSGTTGFSKGVVLSANSLAGNVEFAMRAIELNAGERMLAFCRDQAAPDHVCARFL
jgi:long-chain acyl-CoA synthetase